MQRAAAVEVEEGVKGLARRAPLRQGPPEAMEALPWLAQAVGAAGQSCPTQPAP